MRLPELKQCTTTEWEITDCFFGGSFDKPVDERLTLQRPYLRVDRVKLQALLRQRFAAAGGVAITGKLEAERIAPNLFDRHLVHDSSGSVLTLDNGSTIRTKLVVDASGLESRLTARETPYIARGHPKAYPVGFQIAYGFIVHVTSLGPYDEKAMTLFDYRLEVVCSDLCIRSYLLFISGCPSLTFKTFFCDFCFYIVFCRTNYLSDDPDWEKDACDRPTVS